MIMCWNGWHIKLLLPHWFWSSWVETNRNNNRTMTQAWIDCPHHRSLGHKCENFSFSHAAAITGGRRGVCDPKRGAQEKGVLHALGDQVSQEPFSRQAKEYLSRFCAVLITQSVSGFYKAFGQSFIADDHFLSFVGAVSSVFNCTGRLFYGILMDRFCLEMFTFTSFSKLKDKLPDSNGSRNDSPDNPCLYPFHHLPPWQGDAQNLSTPLLGKVMRSKSIY